MLFSLILSMQRECSRIVTDIILDVLLQFLGGV